MPDAPCPVTSRLLSSAGFRHAFFTRLGGVSTGAFASLNFSTSVGDSIDSVHENTARAALWLALSPARLYCVQQVHGGNSVEVTAETTPEHARSIQADALFSDRPGIACCIRTADCVPLLFADPVLGRVAAVHAGWRGIVAGIIPKTIERLSKLGSVAERLLVAIGPHIRVSAFEVSEEVAQAIARVAPETDVIRRSFGSRPHVSLVDCVAEQLKSAGVLPGNVDDVGGCTFSDSERFFSYRRQGAASGRHLHAIVPGIVDGSLVARPPQGG